MPRSSPYLHLHARGAHAVLPVATWACPSCIWSRGPMDKAGLRSRGLQVQVLPGSCLAPPYSLSAWNSSQLQTRWGRVSDSDLPWSEGSQSRGRLGAGARTLHVRVSSGSHLGSAADRGAIQACGPATRRAHARPPVRCALRVPRCCAHAARASRGERMSSLRASYSKRDSAMDDSVGGLQGATGFRVR